MSVDTHVDYGVLADVVRDELARAGFITNACILAARVSGMVLRELGVDGVEAMACELDVFSPVYLEMRLAEAGGVELTEAVVDEYTARGAWHVQCRFGEAPAGVTDRRDGRGYDAHVVTLVDRAWMIDPTMAQADRPEKGLIVEPPFAWPIDYEQARTGGAATIFANGTASRHRLLPGRKDFTRAPDWRKPRLGDPVVQRILRRLTHD